MRFVLAGVVVAACCFTLLPAASAAPVAVSPAAPYLFLGWGEPLSPSAVMEATGVRSFTMAFILSDGGCSPVWEGGRPFTGGADEATIEELRAAGVTSCPHSTGGVATSSGRTVALPEELTGAYQEVLDAYGLTAIDIDIENTDEFENEVVQNRILGALKMQVR